MKGRIGRTPVGRVRERKSTERLMGSVRALESGTSGLENLITLTLIKISTSRFQLLPPKQNYHYFMSRE